MNDLEKSILSTLVYYDVLDRPLTGWEVFKYLQRPKEFKVRPIERNLLNKVSTQLCRTLSLNNVLEALENSSELAKFINQKNGFYFLKNRGGIIKKRIERQKISDQKRKKVKRIVKFLQIISFVRLVAVSGSLAMNNTKEKSDIDLLIITKSGRIWTCRG
ncbi:MAG: nucleotidyltransferase domain-containing protein, partial [Candidatus Portnoybacteria bacterium]|nr:nucleotidyltransferase domain-containing protein [Candidatus Portnoybacteria bacterium]